MSKKKSRQKQKRRKKVTFSGLVDGWREADRKNPEMRGLFGFPIDFRFLESEAADDIFEGIVVFVGFFLLDSPPGKAQKLDNKDLVHQHSESLILHCVNGCDM